MAPHDTVDDQLAELVQRRWNCMTLLIQCINELAVMGKRADALLDWKLDGDGGPLIEPDQMT